MNYTTEQKASIIYSLVLISGVDGSIDMKIMDYASQIATQLGIDVEDKAIEIAAMNKAEKTYKVLSKLSENQKEHYSIILGEVANYPDKTGNKEKMMNRIIEQVGISQSDFISTNRKMRNIVNKNISKTKPSSGCLVFILIMFLGMTLMSFTFFIKT